MKRKMSLSIIACWLFGLLFSCFSAFAEEGVQVGDLGNGFIWTYYPDNGTLSISGKGIMPDIDSENYYSDFERTYWDADAQINTLIIRDGITQVSSSLQELIFEPRFSVKTLVLGKDISSEKGLTGYVEEKYLVSDDNDHLSVYDDLLYNENCTKLIACPNNKSLIDFNENLKEIGDHAFSYYHFADKITYQESNGQQAEGCGLIIPWGVETLGYSLFDHATVSINDVGFVVLPDTITSINKSLWPSASVRPIIVFSKDIPVYDELNQEMIAIDALHQWGFYIYDSVAEYYPNALLTGLIIQNGKAYIYDANGNMLRSGWYQAEGNWYYLNDYGAGVVNCWRLKDGKYVYLGADGKMKTSCWVKDYNNWYYVKADGTRYESSWAKIGGVWYWFGGSGKMAESQWLKLDGEWYYFRFGGQMATGWIKDGNKWYYLTGSGAMATNKWVKSGNYWYYLGSSGAMLTNTITPDGYRVDSEGRWV